MPMLLGVLKGRAGFAGGFSSMLEEGEGEGEGGGGVAGVVGVATAVAVAVGGVASGLLLLPAPIVKLFKLTLFFS